MRTVTIYKKNLPKGFFQDVYHKLMRLSWPQVFLAYAVFFLTINAVFGFLFYLSDGLNKDVSYLEAFFFSVHTFTTIGYGHISPVTYFADLIVTVEIMIGLLSTALTTGLVFSKFSVPAARILFTDKALITNFDGRRVLMFRVANARHNEIINAQVSVSMSRREQTDDGSYMRRFYPLPLLKSHVPLFALSWQIFHEINEQSPLYGLTSEQLKQQSTNIVTTISGTDTTNGQSVHTLKTYTPDDVLFDKLFQDVLTENEHGHITIDYSHFHGTR
jgi:inward rectifier potassium channel